MTMKRSHVTVKRSHVTVNWSHMTVKKVTSSWVFVYITFSVVIFSFVLLKVTHAHTHHTHTCICAGSPETHKGHSLGSLGQSRGRQGTGVWLPRDYLCEYLATASCTCKEEPALFKPGNGQVARAHSRCRCWGGNPCCSFSAL